MSHVAILDTWSRVFLVAIVTLFLWSITSCQSPDENGVVLTPWWNLTFGDGERVTIDCGVDTGGNPDVVKLAWINPQGNVVSTNETQRTFATRKDKLNETIGAFSVLTLTLNDLELKDTGSYTCQTTWGPDADHNRTISLQVVERGFACGFEDDTFCGWKNVTAQANIGWQWRGSDDPDVIKRIKGSRSDHTYGPSRTGHFLDVDSGRQFVAKRLASVESPQYPPHNETNRCLMFWYSVDGKIKYLKVIQKDKDGNKALTNVTDSTNKKWRLETVTISPTSLQYQILFEADLCEDTCDNLKQAIGLDDIRLMDGACSDINVSWPDRRLPVRLRNGTMETEGRLEVLHAGQWGTVCDTKFGKKDAAVACRRLGYPTEFAYSKRSSYFGEPASNYQVWLNRLQCTGKEDDIADCIISTETWGDHGKCSNAAVFCPNTSQATTTTTARPTLRPTKPTTKKPVTKGPDVTGTPGGDINATSAQPTADSNATQYSSTARDQPPGAPPDGGNDAVIIVVVVVFLFIAIIAVFFIIRRRRSHKSNYTEFSNPKYSREHLPTNENINLDSPLTWGQGHSVLA